MYLVYCILLLARIDQKHGDWVIQQTKQSRTVAPLQGILVNRDPGHLGQILSDLPGNASTFSSIFDACVAKMLLSLEVRLNLLCVAKSMFA